MIKKKPIHFYLTMLFSMIFINFPVYCFATPSNQIDGHDPTKPYPYKEEEISFVNLQAGITLFGTLTIPPGIGPFPAVEILPGEGPDRRDGYDMSPKAHKWLVLADYLTRRGIATLRYDKRGVGSSSGDFQNATSQDLANDAGFGVEYLKNLKEVNVNKVGIVGQSEGGLIAPMVAAHSKDVAFIVLMAGPGLRGDQILLHQQYVIDQMNNIKQPKLDVRREITRKILEEAIRQKDYDQFRSKVREIVQQEMASLAKDDPKMITDEQEWWIGKVNSNLLTPWGKFFLLYDPQTSLKLVTCPVLVIDGDKDWRVPPDENFPVIESALKESGNHDFLLKSFPNMGHGLQTLKDGSLTEFADPLQPLAPEVLFFIGDWIEKHTK